MWRQVLPPHSWDVFLVHFFAHGKQGLKEGTRISYLSPTEPGGSIRVSITYANEESSCSDWPSAPKLPVLHWVLSSWPRPRATSRLARHFPVF